MGFHPDRVSKSNQFQEILLTVPALYLSQASFSKVFSSLRLFLWFCFLYFKADVFNDFQVCGKVKNSRSLASIHRIVGGVNAKPGDLPWQAALRYGNSGKTFIGQSFLLPCGNHVSVIKLVPLRVVST